MALNDFPRSATKSVAAIAFAVLSSFLLVACGGGDSVTATTRYKIGGSASGLVGSGLVLQDNGGDNLAVSGSGPFTFATPLTNGSSYAVTVATQPTSPAQDCVVTSGTGSVIGANVESVAVACTTNGYTVGGAVSGLTGSGLVLQDNGGNDLPISAAGAFTFTQTVGSGVAYAVTVKTQPTNPNQTCSVVNGTGTMGSANVTDVAVNCSVTTFTVSGTITGLVGTGLVLQTSGVTIPITGTTFSIALASGMAFNVVATPPSNPTQNCVVVNGTGTITNANVSDVTVTCTISTYTVSGTITGLTGTGLVLQTHGTNIPITGSAFSVTLASGTAYTVTATAQPTGPSQVCMVGNPSGTVTNANINNVTVACTTSTFTVSGTITGLSGTGLVLMTNGTNVPISGSAFSVTLASGTPYNIMATAQPTGPSQTCVVTNPAGTVTTANITGVSVACTTRTFTVSGTITGLSGTGLVLKTNGTIVPITGSTFSVTLASGTAYSITATTQPSAPTQTCAVTNGVGTVTTTNITGVTVACTTTNFTVSGTITGLNGTGLALVTNATPVPITGSTFSVTLASGTAFAIAVQTQPQTPAQYCVVQNGTGTVAAANITGAAVSCRNEGIYAFAADTAAGAVSSFAIAPISGSLGYVNSQSTSSATSQPAGLALEVLPLGAGTYLYAADFNSADISIFSVNPTNGTLTYQSAATTGTVPVSPAAGSTPTAIAIDPTGNFALVVDSQNAVGNREILVFQIDQSLGTLTQISGSPFLTAPILSPGNNTSSVALSVNASDPQYAFATNQYAPTIGVAAFLFNDPTSGQLTATTPWQVATGNSPVWVTVDPTDHYVYVSNQGDGTISGYTIGAGGVLRLMTGGGGTFGVGANSQPGAISIDPTGRFLYVADYFNNQVVEFIISPTDGTLSGATTYGTGLGPFAVNVDPSGHFVYVGDSSDGTIAMFTADPITGNLTAIGAGPLSYNDVGSTAALGTNALAVQ